MPSERERLQTSILELLAEHSCSFDFLCACAACFGDENELAAALCELSARGQVRVAVTAQDKVKFVLATPPATALSPVAAKPSEFIAPDKLPAAIYKRLLGEAMQPWANVMGWWPGTPKPLISQAIQALVDRRAVVPYFGGLVPVAGIVVPDSMDIQPAAVAATVAAVKEKVEDMSAKKETTGTVVFDEAKPTLTPEQIEYLQAFVARQQESADKGRTLVALTAEECAEYGEIVKLHRERRAAAAKQSLGGQPVAPDDARLGPDPTQAIIAEVTRQRRAAQEKVAPAEVPVSQSYCGWHYLPMGETGAGIKHTNGLRFRKDKHGRLWIAHPHDIDAHVAVAAFEPIFEAIKAACLAQQTAAQAKPKAARDPKDDWKTTWDAAECRRTLLHVPSGAKVIFDSTRVHSAPDKPEMLLKLCYGIVEFLKQQPPKVETYRAAVKRMLDSGLTRAHAEQILDEFPPRPVAMVMLPLSEAQSIRSWLLSSQEDGANAPCRFIDAAITKEQQCPKYPS